LLNRVVAQSLSVLFFVCHVLTRCLTRTVTAKKKNHCPGVLASHRHRNSWYADQQKIISRFSFTASAPHDLPVIGKPATIEAD
jgi:hypothetical protein